MKEKDRMGKATAADGATGASLAEAACPPSAGLPGPPACKRQKREKPPRPAPTNDPALWPRCKFWMHKKGRFCNMRPAPGVDFCGVHVADVAALGGVAPVPPQRNAGVRVEGEKGIGHGALAKLGFLSGGAQPSAAAPPPVQRTEAQADGGEATTGERTAKKRDWRERGKRIPCPHDPRHSIYEQDLQRHLTNCPMYKQMQAVKAQACYSENINLPAAGAGVPAEEAIYVHCVCVYIYIYMNVCVHDSIDRLIDR